MRSLRSPWLLALAGALLPAACGGKGGVRHAAPADIPVDLLTRAPDALRIVQVHHGVPYLFLGRAPDPYAGDGPPGPLPCWFHRGGDDGGGEDGGGSDGDGCAATAPLPAGLDAGPVPATVAVVGPAGPCTATVGAPVQVDTSGCEPSSMIGAPLTGCPATIAPIARTDGFDPALRWHPAPTAAAEPLVGADTRVTDPVHRALVTRWLAEPALAPSRLHAGQTVRVTLDVGAEALETITAGFLLGDGDDECAWEIGGRTEVGLRRGARLEPLAVAGTWDGALSWRGRVVGVASGAPRDVRVQAVGPAGQVTTVLEREVWWDNEECRAGDWAQPEYPCGP